MPVEIICSDAVCRQMKKLNRNTARQIVKSLFNLKSKPKEDIIRIANSDYYKMRIGDFRVIFDIKGEKLRILTIKSSLRG